MPELLGRLPIRVSLSPISKAELIRILKEPQFNLLMQQQNLLEVEKVTIIFTEDVRCHLFRVSRKWLKWLIK